MYFTAVSLMSSNSMTDKRRRTVFLQCGTGRVDGRDKSKELFPSKRHKEALWGRVANTVNTSGHQRGDFNKRKSAIIIEGD